MSDAEPDSVVLTVACPDQDGAPDFELAAFLMGVIGAAFPNGTLADTDAPVGVRITWADVRAYREQRDRDN